MEVNFKDRENMQTAQEPITNLNAKTGGLSYSVATVSLLLFTLVFAVLAAILIYAANVNENSAGMLYLNLLVSPVAIAVTVFAVLKKYKIKFFEIAPLKCKPKYYLMAVMLIFGLLFALSWVNTVTVEFLKLFGYEESAGLQKLENHISGMSGWGLIPALLIVAVFPAVMEELLFRGLILRNAERTAGAVASVFLAGFAFSLFHGSPEQMVYQFILGCIFAFITIRSGSILPATLMHFINNALVVLLIYFHAYNADGSLNISNGGTAAIFILSALCLIGGLVWLILDKTPLIKGRKGEVKKFFLFGSVGIAVMAIIWICSLLGVS